MQHTDRFLNHLECYTLPRPPAPVPSAGNFMVVPHAFMVLQAWQLALYQHAYQVAQEIVRPSVVERDLAGVWN